MQSDEAKPGNHTMLLTARATAPANPLTPLSFEPNPGNLRMFAYLPAGLETGAPLVVVLHGCGQTAAGYAVEAGWCALAERLGFALLAPEQKAVNNPNTCFDWFNPEDIARGQGEAGSIAAMIGTMVTAYRLDKSRVFITGLSAGGAMTSVMLATYPALFAGGAIIAGLPFAAASNVREALDAMRSAPLRSPREWGDAVRAASSFAGPWPKVSIWHGALDTVVNINNAQASVAQWANLQGVNLADPRQELVDGAVHLRWGDSLELYTLPMLGHGTPIDGGDVGTPAPFILQAGISSSRRIAEFWGLATAPTHASEAMALSSIEGAIGPRTVARDGRDNLILRALKAAGLVRKG